MAEQNYELNYDLIRKRLEDERDDVRRSLDMAVPDFADDGSPGLGNHPADVANEVFEQTKALSQRGMLAESLENIERALEKLDEGHYGLCESCGRPIDPERLEAMPAVRFCLEDQQRMEQALSIEDVRIEDEREALESGGLGGPAGTNA